MKATPNPIVRVRVRTATGVVDGTVWSPGPEEGSYWVVPDEPQPNMTQGCIKAAPQDIEENEDAGLW